MVDNVRGGISKCIGVQNFKILQKTETQFLFIYTHLWPTFSFYNNLCPLTRIFTNEISANLDQTLAEIWQILNFLSNSKYPNWSKFFCLKNPS